MTELWALKKAQPKKPKKEAHLPSSSPIIPPSLLERDHPWPPSLLLPHPDVYLRISGDGGPAEMVFSSPLVVGVAAVSAHLCQYIACNPQRLSADDVLQLLCCLPLRHLRRLALCLWSFFCFPGPAEYYPDSDSSSPPVYYYSSASSSSGSDYGSDYSHSD